MTADAILVVNVASSSVKAAIFGQAEAPHLTKRLPDVLGQVPERVLALHLCNGSSLCAIRGGLDAAAFTGGIRKKGAAIWAAICAGLAFLGGAVDADANSGTAARIEASGSLPVAIIPAREEAYIAADTRRMARGGGDGR